MPWTNQGGGGSGGGGQGPWGRGPAGPGQPDLEEFLRRSQERMKRWFPGGAKGMRGILILVLIAVAIWLASGFYRVQPDEQGVVLRFGEWIKTTQPGLNYHLPTPIESVVTPKILKINRVEIGFRSNPDLRGTGIRPVPAESLMLTGDENIVDINFTVFWQIKDAGQFLFNIRNPEQTVHDVAESAMREIIGKTEIATALAEGRAAVEAETHVLVQAVLDEYGAGIFVRNVEMQKVDPPEAVIDAFRDVQRARADQQREINQAEGYRRDILPRARGEAERILQEAQAYRQERIAAAQGDAQRFLSVYAEYRQAKEITRKRIFLETMEGILAGMDKIIIDIEGSGVLPYLPLNELQKSKQQGEN